MGVGEQAQYVNLIDRAKGSGWMEADSSDQMLANPSIKDDNG